MIEFAVLPALQGLVVWERGWLSSNNVLVPHRDGASLIDTGHVAHAAQTRDLVQAALGEQVLHQIAHTHLHSDHCGGTACLQSLYPDALTWVPEPSLVTVQQWNTQALTHDDVGQWCERFNAHEALRAGGRLVTGDRSWTVHAAPGHDPDAVLLFDEKAGVLMSGDALWHNGFGVVFPEVVGQAGFDAVGKTLDLIQDLYPTVVIPGHGAPFDDVQAALGRARSRLRSWQSGPLRHARHAAKVLVVFHVMEWGSLTPEALQTWLETTPMVAQMHQHHFADEALALWARSLVQDLLEVGPLHLKDGRIQAHA